MKQGRKALGHKQSNAGFNFGAAREYSDLYQAAKASRGSDRPDIERHQQKVGNTVFRWTTKVETPLDKLFAKKKSIKARISVLCEKRDVEGLSAEEQRTLDGLFADLRRINNDPLMVERHKEMDLRNAAAQFKDELTELYLLDTRFLPKEKDQFLSKHRDLIEDSRFVFDGVVFEFVKCADTIQYHWVKL